MAPRGRVGAILLLFVSCAGVVTMQAQSAPLPVCRPGAAAPDQLRGACALLAAMPDRYASGEGRFRQGPERLRESVVKLEGSRIDLEPLLSELRPILYRVRFQPVAPPHSAPNQPFEVVIDGNALMWTADWPAATGLFRARIYPALPMGSPRIGDEAWVLVAEGRFADTNTTFTRLAQAVGRPADGAATGDQRLLLRALLDELIAPPR